MDRTATNQGSQNNSEEWGEGKRERGGKKEKKEECWERKEKQSWRKLHRIGIFSNYMMEF